MRKLLYTLFLVFILISLQAQEFSEFTPKQYNKDTNYGSFNYVHLMYFKGDHLTYPEGFEDAFANGYNALELKMGWQSTGRQDWQQRHKYPVYGLGVFVSSLGDSDADSLVGAPNGVFFYYGEPLVRFWRFTAFFDMGIGLSYDFNPYDAENNPTNDVIGSRVNLYFNGNMYLMYKLSERYDLTLGANFFHFSDGRTNTPQRGINLAGLNVGVKYNFNPMTNYAKHSNSTYQPQIRPTYISTPKPPIDRYGELQFMASIGTVETEPGEAKTAEGVYDTTSLQKRYTTSTLSIDYTYLTLRKLKLQVGLDGMFDGSLENSIEGIAPQDVDFGGKAMLGYHFGFQYLIERFAFYYALGFYAYKETEQRGNWYMRAGGRIGITPKIDAHVALKTRNGGIADWIEWGLAYKLKIHD